MKKLLAILLCALCLLACFPAAMGEGLIAPAQNDVTCVRSALVSDEAGNVAGSIYVKDANGALVEIMTYHQFEVQYTNSAKVYRLPSDKLFVETSSGKVDGTEVEHNYMIINPNSFVVEKHVFDPGVADGMLLTNALTDETLYEVTISEFMTAEENAQEVRNVLNTQFSLDGVVFTDEGIVANNALLLYDLDNLALITLPTADNAEAPVVFGDEAFTTLLPTEEAATTDESLTTGEDTSSSSSSSSSAAKSSSSSSSKSSSSSNIRSASKGEVTITDSVNMRKNPNKSSTIITSIPKGKVVDFEGKIATDSRSVDWYKVSYNGKTGWISSRYAVRGKQSVSTSESASGYVTVTGDAHLRKKPSKDSSSLGTIPKGKQVKIVGSSKKDSRGVLWYNVTYDGKTGYVSSKYSVKGKVSVSGSSSSKSGSTYILTTGSLHLRGSASLSGKDLGTIPSGTKLTYKNESKKDSRGVRWYKVKYDGKTGWVSSKYSKKVN